MENETKPMSIDKLAEALSKAQSKMTNPPKNKQGQCRGGKYMYADLADVMDHVRAPLTENGLSVVQVINAGVLTTRLIHSSGQFIESNYPLPTTPMSAQDMGSAITYARRYSICPLLGIAGETDDDAQGAQDASHAEAEAKAEELRMKMKDAADAAKRKVAAAAGDMAKAEGRLKDANTGETIKPAEAVVVPEVKPEEKKPATGPVALAGIAPELAQMLSRDGISPDAISKYAVRHLAKEVPAKEFKPDYIKKMLANWDKVVSEIKKGNA
jgi:hypothetical protein